MVKVIVKPKKAQNDSIPPASSDSIPPPWVITPVNDTVKRPEIINPTRKKGPRYDDSNTGDVRVNIKFKKVKIKKKK